LPATVVDEPGGAIWPHFSAIWRDSLRAADVPAISDHWVSSCAEHRGMTGDPTLLRGLLRVLFSPTPPRDPGV